MTDPDFKIKNTTTVLFDNPRDVGNLRIMASLVSRELFKHVREETFHPLFDVKHEQYEVYDMARRLADQIPDQTPCP
jgi:hypothetical protein